MLSLSYFGMDKGQAEHIRTKLDTISNQLVLSSMSFIIDPTVEKNCDKTRKYKRVLSPICFPLHMNFYII